MEKKHSTPNPVAGGGVAAAPSAPLPPAAVSEAVTVCVESPQVHPMSDVYSAFKATLVIHDLSQ